MTLFTATIIAGLTLVLKGVIWLWKPNFVKSMQAKFLREDIYAYVFFGGAAVWFLWEISQLGPADFGEYKSYLMLLFGAVALGCFKYVKDFLVVRGVAILILLLAKLFLDAAYLEPQSSRLFLVVYCYLLIIYALYIGAVPYQVRNFSNWIFQSSFRVKCFAYSFLIYGALLTFVAFSY